MSKALKQLREDRAIRDAARAVLMADVVHARASFSAKGVATRVGGRIGDGAKDIAEVAKSQASDNVGIFAAIIGAVLLWLGRDTILELLGLTEGEDAAEDAGEDIGEDTGEDELDHSGEPLPQAAPLGDDNEH